FAVTSEDYLNINIRFGYHFVVIDALLGPESRQNYISLQFKGGGATLDRRFRRIRFLDRVLTGHGFEIRLSGDRMDVRQRGNPLSEMEKKLEMLGFLLGFTRLLDQKLENDHEVQNAADQFLAMYPPS
ncbi:MAG: pyruvate phosphate dikinase, partial [Deltaproteobacteria bacterium]|nr:pyruvate phosphate dikinase [Deltaproteobacteria bacterium]